MTRKRLFLIDAFAHIFRAFFAIKNIDNNAAFGFSKVLKKLLDEEKPDFIIAAFDSPEPSFRKALYPPYKANREAPPEGLIPQIPLIKEIVGAYGVPVVQQSGFEADDIIGTLATQAAEQGLQAVIVSSDKDFLQLLRGDEIVFFDPYRDVRYLQESAVLDYFGVRADQIIDLLAIWGDSSDNVPGVSGVGEKGAKSLIQKYGSLDAIYQNLDKISRKSYRRGFEDARDSVSLMRELVTIRQDVDVSLNVVEAAWRKPDKKKLEDIFVRLNFKSLLDDDGAEKMKLSTCAAQYALIDSPQELEKWVDRIQKLGFFVFDVEATSLNPQEAQVVGVALAVGSGEAGYVPLRHQDQKSDWTQWAEERLAQVFSDARLVKCAHNLKYDLRVLAENGLRVVEPFHDTMLMSYLVDPSGRHHSLDDLAEALLKYRTISFSEVCGEGAQQVTFDRVPIDRAVQYAAEDADICFRLYQELEPQIRRLDLERVYREIEIPLVPVLARMESSGIRVDVDQLSALSARMKSLIEDLEGEIFELAGETFNIRSTKQLGHILFEKLDLPVIGKTQKTKSFSTNQAVLERLAGMGFDLPQKLLEYRMITKLRSTYVNKIPKMVHAKTGRVHSEFNQFITATGRLSSANPNLQNIPIRTELGREIRAAFVPEPNGVLISADYSQIELRLLAHFSKDDTLMEAFRRGEDIHKRTASEVMGVPLDEVTSGMRQAAKAINFGLIYGMSGFRLGQELGISQKLAKQYMASYFERMPRVPAFQAELIEEVQKSGEVRTYFGRRRAIPEINSRNKTQKKQGERLAINTRIQGTAADIIKLAMVALDQRLEALKLDARLLLQVHDELVLECPADVVDKLADVLRETMEGVVEFDVPLTVDIHQGLNWRDAK